MQVSASLVACCLCIRNFKTLKIEMKTSIFIDPHYNIKHKTNEVVVSVSVIFLPILPYQCVSRFYKCSFVSIITLLAIM